MTRTLAAITSSCLIVMCATSSTAAELKDLLPCKAAALRLCDRSEGLSASALYKCGATLALRHLEVGRACAQVLRLHGHLGPSPGSVTDRPTILTEQ